MGYFAFPVTVFQKRIYQLVLSSLHSRQLTLKMTEGFNFQFSSNKKYLQYLFIHKFNFNNREIPSAPWYTSKCSEIQTNITRSSMFPSDIPDESSKSQNLMELGLMEPNLFHNHLKSIHHSLHWILEMSDWFFEFLNWNHQNHKMEFHWSWWSQIYFTITWNQFITHFIEHWDEWLILNFWIEIIKITNIMKLELMKPNFHMILKRCIQERLIFQRNYWEINHIFYETSEFFFVELVFVKKNRGLLNFFEDSTL